MRARVVLAAGSGSSMTMKRGGWGVRCGVRAGLAAEESLPGIVSGDHGMAGINERIIAESGRSRRWFERGRGRGNRPDGKVKTFSLLWTSTAVLKRANGGASGGYP